MPLILLLDDVFHHFKRFVKRLDHWNELVDLEILLVARARSAFLVHWFGSLIPLDGSSIRIAIVNFEALRQRYSLVMSKRRSQLSEGPSMLEPMAGIAGGLAGSALAPLHFMPIIVFAEPFITDKIDGKLKQILFKIAVAINWLTYGVLGPIVFVLLAALGPLYFIGSAWVPGTAEVQDFLTSATRVVKPLEAFWRQVSGPRDQVKNPIVRATLDVLDKLAVMFPFFMETVAFLIGKVGPLLDPLLHQFQALGNYVGAVLDLATFMITGLVDLLKRWLDSQQQGSLPFHLRLVTEAVGNLITFLAIGISVLLLDEAKDYLVVMGNGLVSYFLAVKDWLVKRIGEIMDENPLIKAVRAVQQRIDVLMPFFARLKADKKKEDDDEDPSRIGDAFKFQFKDVVGDIDWMKENLPKFDLGIDIDDLLWKHGLTPFPLIAPIFSSPTDPFADVATKFAKRPRSIFAGEQKALAEYGMEQFQMPKIEQAVAQAHLDETRLREALLAVASKVLPPEMQPYLQTLSDSMESAEKAFGQTPVADGRNFPVLELPEERKLRPVVGKLMVRVRGAARELSEEWTEGLRVALRDQVYPMPLEQGGTP